ncbi:helix-turn-helix domain-containing protein, partial [Clostridium sp. YIM B02505]
MGRNHLKVESLHEQKIEDLIELKNTIKSKYSRLFLTVIIMRYLDKSTPDIMSHTGLSNPTIVRYIVDWNRFGMKAIVDHRGGSVSKLEPSIVDDIAYVVTKKTPIDFKFTV